MTDTIATAVVGVSLDTSKLDQKLNSLKGKVTTAANGFGTSFEKVGTKIAHSFNKLHLILRKISLVITGIAAASIAKFMKSGTDEAKAFNMVVERVGIAFANLGAKIIQINVLGKNITEWVNVFANGINSINAGALKKMLELVVTIGIAVQAIKFGAMVGGGWGAAIAASIVAIGAAIYKVTDINRNFKKQQAAEKIQNRINAIVAEPTSRYSPKGTSNLRELAGLNGANKEEPLFKSFERIKNEMKSFNIINSSKESSNIKETIPELYVEFGNIYKRFEFLKKKAQEIDNLLLRLDPQTELYKSVYELLENVNDAIRNEVNNVIPNSIKSIGSKIFSIQDAKKAFDKTFDDLLDKRKQIEEKTNELEGTLPGQKSKVSGGNFMGVEELSKSFAISGIDYRQKQLENDEAIKKNTEEIAKINQEIQELIKNDALENQRGTKTLEKIREILEKGSGDGTKPLESQEVQ